MVFTAGNGDRLFLNCWSVLNVTWRNILFGHQSVQCQDTSHFARDLYAQQHPHWAWRFSAARPAECGPTCTGALSYLVSV